MKKTTDVTIINYAEALEIIAGSRRKDGQIFTVEFVRKRPKCERCLTTYKEDPVGDICETPYCHVCERPLGKREQKKGECKICGTAPVALCHGHISRIRKMTCRLGVKNPGEGITTPGTGRKSATGGFDDRISKYSNITAFDMVDANDRTDGKRGGYRCFGIQSILSLTTAGHTYVVQNDEVNG